MTTATTTAASRGLVSVLRGAVLAAAAAGLAVAVSGALFEGSSAAYGALAGTALVTVVFAFGAFTVNTVASVLPSATLLVAMLTYTLQVVLMGVTFAALSMSGLLEGDLDQTWLGGAVIAGTVAWMVMQVISTMRLRIPVYDLPAAGPEASGRRTEAGE